MGESNTVVSAYTMYRHLQQYFSYPSISLCVYPGVFNFFTVFNILEISPFYSLLIKNYLEKKFDVSSKNFHVKILLLFIIHMPILFSIFLIPLYLPTLSFIANPDW